MNKIIILILILLIFGCSKKEDLELEIINKDINCLAIKKGNNIILQNLDEKNGINKNAKTIIVYKLTNNSNKSYYFNFNRNFNKFEKDLFKLNNAYVKFTDKNNKNVQIHNSYYSADSSSNIITKDVYDYILAKELNYNFVQENQNFVIRPNESIYFEYFIVLPYGNYLEDNANWLDINDFNKKYFAEILFKSDSVNYKNFVSRTDLQTIKENGYHVYHGIIKSKNKIPIQFTNLTNNK